MASRYSSTALVRSPSAWYIWPRLTSEDARDLFDLRSLETSFGLPAKCLLRLLCHPVLADDANVIEHSRGMVRISGGLKNSLQPPGTPAGASGFALDRPEPILLAIWRAPKAGGPCRSLSWRRFPRIPVATCSRSGAKPPQIPEDRFWGRDAEMSPRTADSKSWKMHR